MQRHGSRTEIEVQIYATHLANKPTPQKPTYSNDLELVC
jgi:hypothetical protein